jgi:Lsr2
MATRTSVTLIDDIDGGVASETVRFTYDGKSYEIDLSEENLAAFAEAIEPFVANARNTTTPKRSSSGRARPDKEKSTRIREWARSQGIEIGVRGRIPSSVRQAYEVGHVS